MKVRKIVGLVLGCLGLAVIIISGYYFHQLMFIMGLRSSAYLNLYGLHVVTPLSIGVLLIANAIFVAGFNRKAAIPFYALGDITWIFFIININRLITARVLIIEEYFIPSMIFFVSLILLFIGALVNSLE